MVRGDMLSFSGGRGGGSAHGRLKLCPKCAVYIVKNPHVCRTGKEGIPISPDDIPKMKQAVIPGYVFDVFNQLIVENYANGKAIVKQKEVIKRCEKIDPKFKYEWLNVEEIYREQGWKVCFTITRYDVYFEFSEPLRRKPLIL